MSTEPTTMKAVYITEPGDVDVLIYGDQPLPQIKPDEVLIKVHRTSINYIDTYHRTGLYKLPYPAILGRDGAGVVQQIGENVKDKNISIGQRVAFVAGNAYAEYCAVPYTKLVTIPDCLSYNTAVTMMLQGLTAHYLTVDSYNYKPGDTILIHAGAGGTGSLVIQIAKAKGLNVITTVSNDAKVEIVKKLGADLVINTSCDDIYTKVMEFTQNQGVNLVLDGVGKDTYQVSMKCVKKRGFVVFFGNASGPVPPIDPLLLTTHGSIYITRPTLADYIQTRDELQTRFDDLVDMVKNKQIDFIQGPEYALNQIKDAHIAIADRTRVGKIVINVCDE